MNRLIIPSLALQNSQRRKGGEIASASAETAPTLACRRRLPVPAAAATAAVATYRC